jgi:fructose-1,6-bisphosphatase/inositol monophosphatase family enzyme
MHPLLSDLESAVRAAAMYLIDVAASKEEARSWIKPDGSLLLSLDLACDKILVDKLLDVAPIVSEERVVTHHLIDSDEDYLVIDPIDGTAACKRFLRTLGGQVGFGPLVGLVSKRRVEMAVFYQVPHRTLFTAIRGQGVRAVALPNPATPAPRFQTRPRLRGSPATQLRESVMLYFMGQGREGPVVESLKLSGAVENAYRFGGFANDCARLAQGLEDLQLQLSVKPWDFAATLFAQEAGFVTVMDPFGRRVAYDEWDIAEENPVLVAPPHLIEGFLAAVVNARAEVMKE